MATDINAGVQRTMDHVLEEIQKVQQQNLQESVPLKEKIAKNIGKLFSLATKNILMNENIRQEIDINSDEFKNLLESIKKFGLLQSLVVEYRESEVNPNGYELICVAGHRRLTAAKILNIEKVPCLIHQYNDLSDRTGIALSENLNREGLYCLDIADGYAELSKLGWTEEKMMNMKN